MNFRTVRNHNGQFEGEKMKIKVKHFRTRWDITLKGVGVRYGGEIKNKSDLSKFNSNKC